MRLSPSGGGLVLFTDCFGGTMPELANGEQIDDLQYKGLRILQKKGSFRYGTDAVLLANYAADAVNSGVRLVSRLKGEKGRPVRFVDAGTGTGIIPILMCGKIDAAPGRKRFTAVEIQPDMCELAKRSIVLNGQEAEINVVNSDIVGCGLEAGSFDVATVNPPYVRNGSGLLSGISGIARARHEIVRTQEEMIEACAKLLCPQGLLFMVNRPDRPADALVAMRQSGVEPHALTMVHAFPDAAPVMFLCTGRKNGGRGLKVTPPLVIGSARESAPIETEK